jgi:hypothetical protein
MLPHDVRGDVAESLAPLPPPGVLFGLKYSGDEG